MQVLCTESRTEPLENHSAQQLMLRATKKEKKKKGEKAAL